LTAGELLAVLRAGGACAQGEDGSVPGDMNGVQSAAGGGVGGEGGQLCQVVGCGSDLRKLEDAVKAQE
jgi:hypothetical protein